MATPERVFNFSAGPGALPVTVLETVRDQIVAIPQVGASPLEVSHRGEWFEGVARECQSNIRELLGLPDSHHVLFCPGGATQQFSMVAKNLLRGGGRTAEYLITGSWGSKALVEARKEGDARAAWSGKEENFVRTPSAEEIAASVSDSPAYVHFTSNETIQGVEFWPATPELSKDADLVCDSSSDFLSRPVDDLERYAVLYAGAQKNAGPAGVTVALVRDDVLERIPDGLATMLDYRTYSEHDSMYNTPPVFAIWVVMLVTRWLKETQGGLEAQEERNKRKASWIYDVIDGSDGFYRGHASPESRSLMNVTFTLADPDLEKRFVSEAAREGMTELKGHRSVGGIRASIYNAMPDEGVKALVSFMESFSRRNG